MKKKKKFQYDRYVSEIQNVLKTLITFIFPVSFYLAFLFLASTLVKLFNSISAVTDWFIFHVPI